MTPTQRGLGVHLMRALWCDGMAAMRKFPVVLFGRTISVLPKYPNQ
jgi:hypothetical protein